MSAPCTEVEMRIMYVVYLAAIGLGLIFTLVIALRHE
ncbi:hypothetical protein BJ988_003254 [Nocardioides panzhihuensis]|uniref:Uncharacterized protein n=1 Tax=Nocardioides panzhihuensis TaxID=860243 RepID=A0A7Z0IT58_9ACTN|nr:hypothetical protein [Nocardioides panzhihuensis]